MSKITIELSDQADQVALNVTIEGWDDQSKSCQMADRLMDYIDSIAIPQTVKTAGEINAKRRLIPGGVVVHAH